MRDVIRQLDAWTAGGTAAALATVVGVARSAPRPPGAKLAVSAAGDIAGAVSGGCVEGAVIEEAEAAMRDGQGRLLHFGIADEEAWEVGLPCGGEIDVWVEPVREDSAAQAGFRAMTRDGDRGTLVTRLEPGGPPARLLVGADGVHEGSLGSPALDAAAATVAGELMWQERSGRQVVDGVPLFFDVAHPPPRLVIVGAVEIAVALVRLARDTGWRPYVIDPRRRFAAPERFPGAEAVLAQWPERAVAAIGGLDRATAVAVLTHDPKIDDEALMLALRSDAGYIGAMGSRFAQGRRRERLLALGATEADLERIAAPIGLDLGGFEAEETALAVLAEIVALRRGRSGGRLSSSAGRIHDVIV
ncbi:MAG TPA: XdhC family protein [Capillimicrobium sp.]